MKEAKLRGKTTLIIPSGAPLFKVAKSGAYINYPYRNKPKKAIKNSLLLRSLTYSQLGIFTDNMHRPCFTPRKDNLENLLTITNSKICWKPKGVVKLQARSHRNIYPIDKNHFNQKILKKFEDLTQCGNIRQLSTNFKANFAFKKRKETTIKQSSCKSNSCSGDEIDERPVIKLLVPNIESNNKIKETNFMEYNKQIYINKIKQLRNMNHKLIGSNNNSGIKVQENSSVRPISMYHSSVTPFRNENCDISHWRQSIDFFPTILNQMHNEFRDAQLKEVEHLKELFNKNNIPYAANSIEKGLLLPQPWEIENGNEVFSPVNKLISKKQLRSSKFNT